MIHFRCLLAMLTLLACTSCEQEPNAECQDQLLAAHLRTAEAQVILTDRQLEINLRHSERLEEEFERRRKEGTSSAADLPKIYVEVEEYAGKSLGLVKELLEELSSFDPMDHEKTSTLMMGTDPEENGGRGNGAAFKLKEHLTAYVYNANDVLEELQKDKRMGRLRKVYWIAFNSEDMAKVGADENFRSWEAWQFAGRPAIEAKTTVQWILEEILIRQEILYHAIEARLRFEPTKIERLIRDVEPGFKDMKPGRVYKMEDLIK